MEVSPKPEYSRQFTTIVVNCPIFVLFYLFIPPIQHVGTHRVHQVLRKHYARGPVGFQMDREEHIARCACCSRVFGCCCVRVPRLGRRSLDMCVEFC